MEWIVGKIIHIIAVVLLCLLIAFVVERESRTKNNIEKMILRGLMLCGNLVILGIIILSVWAGFSYLKDGDIKTVIGLFLTAILLSLCLGSSIYRKIIKRK